MDDFKDGIQTLERLQKEKAASVVALDIRVRAGKELHRRGKMTDDSLAALVLECRDRAALLDNLIFRVQARLELLTR